MKLHPPSPSLLLSPKADTHFTIPQRVEVRIWQVKEKYHKMLSEYRERWCRHHVWRAVESGERTFRKLAPETGKAHLPTVERLNGGTASWLKEADQSLCALSQIRYLNTIIVLVTDATVICLQMLLNQLNFPQHLHLQEQYWPNTSSMQCQILNSNKFTSVIY